MKRLMAGTSPSMVVALIALFVSLGGVSWAVAVNSIGTKAVKDNSLEGRDIRDETLESRDVVNGGLQSRDVRDGALRGVDINDQSLGGIDLASNTLGDREIDETKLDINRLGGVAQREVREQGAARPDADGERPGDAKGRARRALPEGHAPAGRWGTRGRAGGDAGRDQHERAARQFLGGARLRHGADRQLAAGGLRHLRIEARLSPSHRLWIAARKLVACGACFALGCPN